MARIRSLKPEAFQSETLSEVSVYAERTFLGLSTQVDDRGRVADKPVVLNAALWAVRSEQEPHTARDFEAELDELVAVGLVCRYIGCDGKRYLHLVSWDEHQKVDKASRSRLPRCPHHLSERDECGRHEKEPCPPPPPPEPSRGLPSPRETSATTRDDSANARESSSLDLGPRTLDLSSSTAAPSDGERDAVLIDLPVKPKFECGSDQDPDFVAFWTAYPRKVGKPSARRAWQKLIKDRVDPNVIIAAAGEFRDDPERRRQHKRFTPHPSTWLNDHRFDAEEEEEDDTWTWDGVREMTPVEFNR